MTTERPSGAMDDKHSETSGGVRRKGTCGVPDVSVVLPFYNERDNLIGLLDRLQAALGRSAITYELLFIDDGSTDDGVGLLEARAGEDPRVKVLVFSRNFGQHAAITAGLDAARGRVVVSMDSDLQERPEDIPRLLAKHREGFDIVFTRRSQRIQSRLRAALSLVTLALLNRLTGFDGLSRQSALRLVSSKVVEALRRCPERNRYLGYLIPWTGFRSAEIEIEVDPRRRGRTHYTWLKLARHALTGLTSFSVAPLRISAFCSCLTMLACLAGVLWVLYRYFVYGVAVTGWASLIIVLLVLHAMEFAILAILGEYVGQTYAETKQRPLYLCARAINFDRSVEPERSAARRELLIERSLPHEHVDPARQAISSQ